MYSATTTIKIQSLVFSSPITKGNTTACHNITVFQYLYYKLSQEELNTFTAQMQFPAFCGSAHSSDM